MSAASPRVVIGVGTPMRGDDGLGPHVVEVLATRLGPDPEVDLRVVDGEPTRLIELWRDRTGAVVVDAVRTGARPGTVHRVDHDTAEATARGSASTHSGGVAEAIALARQLDRLPARLVVMGVEPAAVDLGAGLSEVVAQAVPDLVDRVLAELGQQCVSRASAPPTVPPSSSHGWRPRPGCRTGSSGA